MPSFSAGRPGSAHAVALVALVVALVALVVALGGGYAVAQDTAAPKQTVAYPGAWIKDYKADGGRASLIGQVVVPAQGPLAVSAKLNIRKGRGRAFTGGRVTCYLGAVGKQDRSFVTLRPGAAASLSLQSVGDPAAPMSGGTQAVDLYCESPKSPYVVSDARVTAMSLDDIQKLEP